ncbi:fungal-specific transcription factor domain-containing protein [Annulohypoxylon maeteangense]|uniref:fungal-specific transcription factor domain-containing protein n=1 Tax=Annulohypoxylon maeteangense TaxID=1927788 RepID=UPI0020088813|nr:fungal-specific transcription factor domain-containing protein [Annulohypoxylon maeteangense]KAI0880101.1 fungal-specific transcription factor domain-containing protein [Annulohypoxylon maeteangense]
MPGSPPTRQRPLPPPNRRRDKPQLSCNPCRRRKVKCDRQQPCRTCSMRGLAMACTYPDAESRPSDREPVTTVQNRIRELESLVHVLMQKAAPKNPPNVTSVPQPETSVSPLDGYPDPGVGANGSSEPSDCGTLTNTPAGVNYVDGAHWTALLDGISELKDCFQDTTDTGSTMRYTIPSQVVPDYGPQPQLLYGRFAHISKGEILSSLPARPVVDRLISKFFNTIDLHPALLHSGQFIRQYEQFWEDTSSAPIMWVGILFAIMSLSILLSLPHTSSEPNSQSSDVESAILLRAYREKVVQCLMLGKYTKGGPHVLQTLILYIAIEHLLHEDSEFGTHILLGVILNIAMRMGYHRDPKNFPVISPFEGEMRRRTWAAIYQANLIFASQMGLPSMLKDHQIDTEEPHNLKDSDFDEDTTELPPARPDSELTAVLYIITRTRVAHLWEEVRDLATDIRRHKYDEILAMDQKVHVHQRRLPPAFRMQPVGQSITDPPHLIMQRIWLQICFLRLQIVLHKKYFMTPTPNERYSYSRNVTLKAAVEIIEYQHMVYDLVKPDALLYDARWKLSSVMNNEFMLATGVLCHYMKQIDAAPQRTVEGISIEDIKKLLIRSLECWQRFAGTSRHARKAIEAIRLVLKSTSTPTSSPTNAEDEFSQIDFQDPLLMDLNFPCSVDGFYSGDDSTTISDPSIESTPFAMSGFLPWNVLKG